MLEKKCKLSRSVVEMTMRALSKLSIKTTLITPDLSDGFSILALINLDENEDLVCFSGVIFNNFGNFENDYQFFVYLIE